MQGRAVFGVFRLRSTGLPKGGKGLACERRGGSYVQLGAGRMKIRQGKANDPQQRVPAFVREAARQPESTPEGKLQNPTTDREIL